MSTASISYKSLGDASSEAKAVAKKLDKYADSLYSNVYKKLNKYDGSWSDNLTTAKSTTNSKIQSLRTEQSEYESYASSLTGLRDECKRVDKAVRSNVSSLTASFKAAHGIRNSKVENAINYLFTSLNNKTAAGRWIGGKQDEFKAGASYLKSYIKEWYNYEGGKEAIKGMILVVLEVAIAVAGVVTAIATFLAGALTFGAVLVLAAALIGAAIAFQDAWTNYTNEKAAYAARKKNDPATGKRRSDINSYTDYLRSSYMFGDDGETYHYDKFYNGLATGLEITSIVCSVITVANSCGKLLKNGFKWATGSTAKLKDIKMKQIFSKDTFNAFGKKFEDLNKAFKLRGWDTVTDLGTKMVKDFGRNLKNEFWDFKELNGSFNKLGAISSIKNMLGVTKDIVSDGFSVQNICKVGILNIVLPGLTAFSVEDSDVTYISTNEDGQMFFDFTENITVADLHGIGEKSYKLLQSGIDLFSNDNILDLKVLDKLSTMSDINISIPDINIPNIDMNITRVA